MCGSHHKFSCVWMAVGLIGMASMSAPALGDDNNFFGRLFRLGGNSSNSSPNSNPRQGGSRPPRASEPAPGSYESAFTDTGSGSAFIPPTNRSGRPTNPSVTSTPIPSDGPSTPEAGGDSQPRLNPRPRVAPAVTSADPLLTRMALGKSNDGSQFGMFLQIFADGTVIDSEGVHHLSPSDIRPITEMIQQGELSRLRGHCGTPSNDFIDYVHLVVYERRMGRLQAYAFSYGGNPQGCEAGIRHLHTHLEGIQAKISRSPAPATSTADTAGAPADLPTTPALTPVEPVNSGTIIPLSPVDPR